MSDSSTSGEIAVPSLHELCKTGDSETLASLLASLNDPAYLLEAATDEGASPLHVALLYAQPDVVAVLLRAGAPYETEFLGSRPIHLSLAMSGREAYRDACLECLKLLVACKLDVSAQDREGQTAAHIAAFNGCPAALSLLTTTNIDILLKDAGGRLATHAAVEGHKSESLRVLLEEYGSELLLVPDRYGDLLTHLAVRRGAWGCLGLLLELGSDAYLEVPNSSGRSAEAVAAECECLSEFFDVVKGQLPKPFAKTLFLTYPSDEFGLSSDFIDCLFRTEFFESRLVSTERPRAAFVADVLRVHELSYIRSLEEMTDYTGSQPVSLKQVASAVAGCVLAAVDSVLTGKTTNAVCILPSTSHIPARGTSGEPFLFNNAALGAAYARCCYRKSTSKIAILNLTPGQGLDSIIANLSPRPSISLHTLQSSSIKLKTHSYKPWLDFSDPEMVQLYGIDTAEVEGSR